MTQGYPQAEGTCFFCDNLADASIRHMSGGMVRICTVCVAKLNTIARHFGNDLRYWVAVEDAAMEAITEAQQQAQHVLTESDVALAVNEAVLLLKEHYAKEHKPEEPSGDNTQHDTTTPPTTSAQDSEDGGPTGGPTGGPVIF